MFWGFSVVQWSRLCAFTAGGAGLIPGQGTKIPTCCGMVRKNKDTKEKKKRNKMQFNNIKSKRDHGKLRM